MVIWEINIYYYAAFFGVAWIIGLILQYKNII